jgi:putative peptide zinc metalloprotease protein
VFPFNRPGPPGPGDNQSVAIATRDGSMVYDVAFALVTATKNTVLDAHVIAPKNVSAAVSYNCISCVTAALAIQLDLSLPTAPQGVTAARLAALWTQIRAFSRHITSLSLTEIRAQLHQYERQIAQILQPPTASSSAAAAGPSTALTPSPSASTAVATSSAGTAAPSAPASASAPSSGSSVPPSTSPSDTGGPTSQSGNGTAPASSPPSSATTPSPTP